MFKTLALSLLLLLSPPAFAGKHTEVSRAPATTRGCRMAKCPMNMIHCGEGTHRVDVREEGACCPRWKCEPNEDTEGKDCRMAKCPKRFVQCKPGETRVDHRAEGACCPDFKCEKRRPSAENCLHVACTEGRPTCDDTQILINKAEEGSCCPDWECMDDESEEL